MSTRDVASPFFRTYADATSRAADTVFTAGDVGKVAWQQSDNTLWILGDTTPTWISVIGGSGGGGAVSSVFGRVGAVVAVNGDYAASKVTNDSSVSGSTVKDALDTLSAGTGVTSVFGRTGVVVAAGGDYTVAQVTGAVPDTRTLTAGTGLTGGGDLSANRTLSADAAYAMQWIPRTISTTVTILDNQQVVTQGGTTIAAGGMLVIGAGALVSAVETTPTFNIWVPSAKPATLSAQSDYFDRDNSQPDPKWIKFDPGGALTSVTVDTTRRMLKITATGDGSIRFAGMVQPLVDVEEVYFTSVGQDAKLTASGSSCDLVLLEGLTSTSKFLAISRITTTTTNLIRVRHFTAYNASATADATQSQDAPYLSLRRNGTTFFGDFSIDGIEFQQLFTGTAAFTPAYVGLFVESGSTGEPVTGSFDFFFMKTASGASVRRTYLPGAPI